MLPIPHAAHFASVFDLVLALRTPMSLGFEIAGPQELFTSRGWIGRGVRRRATCFSRAIRSGFDFLFYAPDSRVIDVIDGVLIPRGQSSRAEEEHIVAVDARVEEGRFFLGGA